MSKRKKKKSRKSKIYSAWTGGMARRANIVLGRWQGKPGLTCHHTANWVNRDKSSN
jgi:hypothetical protein